MLKELEILAERMGLTVRYDKFPDDEMETNSGVCRIKDRTMLIVNIRLDKKRRIEVLCRELGRMELDEVYIKPFLRAFLEETRE